MLPERFASHRIGVEKFAEQNREGGQFFVVRLIARNYRAGLLKNAARIVKRSRLGGCGQQKPDEQHDGKLSSLSRTSLAAR